MAQRNLEGVKIAILATDGRAAGATAAGLSAAPAGGRTPDPSAPSAPRAGAPGARGG